MANLQLLNNITHKDLRVKSYYSAEFGDNVSSVVVFPNEFELLHKEYPILLHRHQENGLQALVLLGIKSGENLYLSEHYPHPPAAGSWMARYVPGLIAKGPFMIGYQHQHGAQEPVIHVNMDHSKITEAQHTDGQQVFLPQGGESHYLQNIATTLNRLHVGQEEANAFYDELDKLKLLTPVNLSIELNTGDKVSIQGHETICSDTFSTLSGDVLANLNAKGWLALIIYIQSSLSNVSWLIDMKNALEYSRS